MYIEEKYKLYIRDFQNQIKPFVNILIKLESLPPEYIIYNKKDGSLEYKRKKEIQYLIDECKKYIEEIKIRTIKCYNLEE